MGIFDSVRSWVDPSRVGKTISWLTDTAGLTDTKAGERGLNAMTQGVASAQQQLDTEMAPVYDMYGNAQQGRQMGDVLNAYQQQMMGTENAASPEMTWEFLNPMMGLANEEAGNQALAGAGSSLQSSAANNAVARAVADNTTAMWQQAFNNAMADAQNKQGIYGNVAQSNLMPSLNWAQLQSDMAGTKYTGAMDVAQASGQVAGQNQSWFGNLF